MKCVKIDCYVTVNQFRTVSDRTQLTVAVLATYTAFLTSCVLAYVPTIHTNPLPPPYGYMKHLDKVSRFD